MYSALLPLRLSCKLKEPSPLLAPYHPSYEPTTNGVYVRVELPLAIALRLERQGLPLNVFTTLLQALDLPFPYAEHTDPADLLLLRQVLEKLRLIELAPLAPEFFT